MRRCFSFSSADTAQKASLASGEILVLQGSRRKPYPCRGDRKTDAEQREKIRKDSVRDCAVMLYGG